MASEWDSEDSDSPILASYYSPERQADTKLAYFETMNEGPLWGVSLSDKLETPKPTARRLQSSNGFEKCFKSPFDLYFSTKDMCCIPMDCDELSTVISVQNIANIPFISISPNISAAARKKFHSGADGTIIGTVSKAEYIVCSELDPQTCHGLIDSLCGLTNIPFIHSSNSKSVFDQNKKPITGEELCTALQFAEVEWVTYYTYGQKEGVQMPTLNQIDSGTFQFRNWNLQPQSKIAIAFGVSYRRSQKITLARILCVQYVAEVMNSATL